MRRRDFITLVTVVPAVAQPPRPARAQTSGVRRVGVVFYGSWEPSVDALRDGLKAAGLEEGRHVALLMRDAKGDVAATEAAARALERDDNVDVIVAITTTAALAVKRATIDVPIVFAAGADPVAVGLVDSIAAPGGRLTGFNFLTNDLTAKRLQILREVVPNLRRVVTFYDPRNRSAVLALAAAQEAGRKLGIDVAAQEVTSPEEIRHRLHTLTAADAEAFFFIPTTLTNAHEALIVEAALALRLPAMVLRIDGVRRGALVCYGPDYRQYGLRLASYVARILTGSRPRDLPVETVDQPALAINLKTAKAIGLEIPPALLLRADEVIE
jgi:putative ABC transport system substrate-binding protein